MEKLIGVGLALALSAGLGGAWYVQAPTDASLKATVDERPVLPRVQDGVASSPSLIAEMVAKRAEASDNVRILLGTSELEQTTEDTAHPVRFSSENDCGFSLMAVGNAGCQSLWQATEVAALDAEGALPGRKIALMLGTQWFMGSGLSESAFAEKFSEESFAAAMGNERLSDETKEKIYQRCLAMGADQAQTLKALREAESYDGPSIVICYCPCLEQHIKAGMSNSQLEMKKAVECGYWHLYRYDPRRISEGKNPFQLDSPEPDTDKLMDFLMGENRFASLKNNFPEKADALYAKEIADVKARYAKYKKMAQD